MSLTFRAKGCATSLNVANSNGCLILIAANHPEGTRSPRHVPLPRKD